MRFFRRNSYRTFLLFFLFMTAFLVNNGVFPTNGQEARTLVAAREIVNGGSWGVPTINGELAIDKPPLAIWVAASIETVSPGNVSFHRTAAGLMGIVWALAFFGIARYMYRRKYFAEIATIIFITCYNVIYMGRMVNRDIYGYALMMAAIYFIFRMLYDDRYYDNPHKWRWAALAGVMMGLSELGDGSVAFVSMLLPAMIAMIVFKRPQMKGKWLPLGMMLLIAVVIFGWWYLYMWINHPSTLAMVIRSEIANWLAPSKYPWFYYWRFFAEMGVWCILVLAALFIPYWKKHIQVKGQYFIAITWLLLALLLLSIMPNKGMIRLLPLAPPCSLAVALVLAHFHENWPSDAYGKKLFYFNGFAVALSLLLLPIIIHFRIVNRGFLDFGTGIFVTVLFIILFLFIVVSVRHHEVIQMVWGIGVLFMVMECFMIDSIGKVFSNSHKNSICAVQGMKELKGMTFYHPVTDTLRAEVVYGVNQRIDAIDMTNEQMVIDALPFVVVTQKPLAEELAPSLLQQIDTVKVGIYDDNNLPRRSRLYNSKLINQVSILRAKR